MSEKAIVIGGEIRWIGGSDLKPVSENSSDINSSFRKNAFFDKTTQEIPVVVNSYAPEIVAARVARIQREAAAKRAAELGEEL